MNSLSLRSGTVEIAGDITIDWNLAHIPGIQANSKTWTADATTRAFNQRGGAALLADLIGEVAIEMRKTQRCDYTLCSEFTVDDSISPTDKRFNHSYALLQPVPSGDKWPDGKPNLVWRISQFLGVDRVSAPQLANPKSDVDQCRSLADIVVLDDAALGFRDHSSSWPVSITNPQPTTWVVLKCARPVVRGALWEHLTRHFAERLIVIMAVEDLRDSEVQISNQLSWERTAQDLFWELTYNPRVNGASSCAHTVVSFGTSGAFLLSRRTEPHETIEDNDLASLSGRLFFDPEVRESGWEGDRPGNMLGNTTVLTAAIVRQLMIRPGAPDISKGIQTGIAGMRRLFRDGFGKYSPLWAEVQIDFPLRAVAAELAAEPNALANASIQDPARKLKGTNTRTQTQIAEGYWTILEDSHRQSLNALAEQIVVFGLKKSLNGVPIGSYGALQTVDRREIEALNSIQNLIGEYCGQPPTRPLSIAVFGPPGSGKSFGVEQVAKSVRPGRIEIRTFNLSQFAGPEDLLGALHQVRDISLRGKLPLVFWDEFDTTLHQSRLGWLRFFLSPMQDGNFQEGQVTHPIGSCIFVFAGGTSHHFAGFGATLGKEEFKAVKGPDFVSRLKGFLNVLGPNCQSTADGHDPYFIIRRAILLRSIFERNSKQLFQQEHGTSRLAIDSGLLRAFLRIGEYRHGARSIESIIAMSSLAARSCFERSSLPAETQLDLHVNGLDFLSIVHEVELEGELLERLAEAAHDVFCLGKMRDGWKLGIKKSDLEKTHPLLVPYAEIPEEYKESNRQTVRHIPQKLRKAGYVMIPSRSNEPAIEFPGEDLEALAMFEHELWMAGQLNGGIRAESVSPGVPAKNKYNLPWDQLPDGIKQIDRDLIRGIPKILSQAGFAVSKLR